MDEVDIDWSPFGNIVNGVAVELFVFIIATVIPSILLGLLLKFLKVPNQLVGYIVGLAWIVLAVYLVRNGYLLEGLRF